MLKPEGFKALLDNVPGVTGVEWHTNKTEQGDVGNHDCERNLFRVQQDWASLWQPTHRV